MKLKVFILSNGYHVHLMPIWSSVGRYWNFVLAIIVIRWPCDNYEYCPIRFTSQLIDIIRVKWSNDVYLNKSWFCCSFSHLYLIVCCFCKALIFQFFSYKLCKSAIIVCTQCWGIFKIAAVLSIHIIVLHSSGNIELTSCGSYQHLRLATQRVSE